MGCASSTPMVATAGSEVLKAATHVAEDASKSAEDAVKDMTQELGKTLDNAKETVSTAVTGIAQELGNTFKEKTEALDEAKNSLMEKLHLNAGDEHATAETEVNEVTEKAVAAMRVHDEAQPASEPERISRAVTPAAHDADSLRSTTPEPEIEQAMANSHEDSPPTPKPTLAELEQLSAVAVAVAGTAALAKTSTTTTTAATTTTTTTIEQAKEEEHVAETASAPPEEKPAERPSTTEWEKYADTLAHSTKFNPLDPYNRASKMRRYGQETNPLPLPHWGENMRPAPMPTAVVYSHVREDSTLSDVNYNSSPLNSTRSSAVGPRRKLPLTLTRNTARKFQREFASLIGGGQKSARPLRAQSKSPALGRKFDYNPNRARIGSSPTRARSLSRSRVASPIHTKTVLLSCLSSPVRNAKLTRSRVASPLYNAGFAKSRIAAPLHNNNLSKKRTHSPINIKVLPRSNLNSPVPTRTLLQNRLNSPHKDRRASSQTHLNALSQAQLTSAMSPKTLSEVQLGSPMGTKTSSETQLNSSTETKARLQSKVMSPTPESAHVPSQHRVNSAAKADTRSRSSRSSTNSSMIIKSNRNSPISRSPSKSSLLENGVQHGSSQMLAISSQECSRSHTPTLDIYGTGRSTPFSMSHTAAADRVVNTSSFLSTPRASPFSIRKQYSDSSDKENQSLFVSDLSSVSDRRSLLSPYKLRDRCLVCNKKYVIK